MSWQKKTYKIHIEEYKLPSATIHHVSNSETLPIPVLQTATCCKAGLLSRAHELVHLSKRTHVSQSPRILDATSMTFSSGPTMAVGRSGCAVAGLDERRVLVAGGFDGCRSAALGWGKVQH